MLSISRMNVDSPLRSIFVNDTLQRYQAPLAKFLNTYFLYPQKYQDKSTIQHFT